MTFEIFREVVLGMKNTEEWADDVAGHLRSTKIFDEGFFVAYESIPAYQALKNILESTFNSEQIDLIYWWLYEDVEKVVWEDLGETAFELKTVKQLYDYIKRMETNLKASE